MTMTETFSEMSDNLCRKRDGRPADYGLENALARKVRRDGPAIGLVDWIAAQFRLTTGEARGVLYGSASRSTLNKVLKRGGWPLVTELMADVLGQPLEDFIEAQAEEARRERAQWEAREKRLVSLEARVRSIGVGGGFVDGPGA